MSVESSITENVDIWTSAIKTKSASGRGSSNKLELYGIKKLRELILDLAIRGKLVPQSLEDGSALELIEKITSEIDKSNKQLKKRKEKPLPSINKEEQHFELPNKWEWVRLGNIGHTNIGLTYKPTNVSESGVPVLRSSNIQNGRIDLSDLVRVGNVDINENTLVSSGDLLICARNGSKALVGKAAIIGNLDEPMAFGAFMAIYRSSVNPFVEVFLRSPVFRSRLEGVSTTTINQITQQNLKHTVMPLPPLAEQNRIVKKVQELMALCDQLESQTEASIEAHQKLVKSLLETLTNAKDADELNESWQRISAHFDVLFTTEDSIEQLKQTILQLAVMGKLVKQDPNDEPASKLLERIAVEKEKLIKDKKIKKQKPLPSISEDEIPFQLPHGWEWCRLPDIGDLNRGKSKHRPRNDKILYEGGTIPLVQTGDVARANGVVTTFTSLYNQVGVEQSRLWPKGTLCITIAANIADTAVLGFDACFPDSVVGFTPYLDDVDVKYIDYYLRTAKGRLEEFAPSTAQKNINLEILSNLLVPLPPKKKILDTVRMIETLFSIVEKLSDKFTLNAATNLKLADSLCKDFTE